LEDGMASTIDWSQWFNHAVVTIYDEGPVSDELELTEDDLRFLKSIKVKEPA
jgi:hypothetical protein